MRDLKINEQIEADRVRLIDLQGRQLGVLAFGEAMRHAQRNNVDLVQVKEDSRVPVCKLLDYKKYVFEKKKRQSASKKKHKRMVLKEVKFRIGTEEGDYKVKLKKLQRFLEQGDRTKITIRFRGREVVYKEQGYNVLNRVINDLSAISEPENESKLEGKQLIIVLRPLQKQQSSASEPKPETKVASGTKLGAKAVSGTKLEAKAVSEAKLGAKAASETKPEAKAANEAKVAVKENLPTQDDAKKEDAPGINKKQQKEKENAKN